MIRHSISNFLVCCDKIWQSSCSLTVRAQSLVGRHCSRTLGQWPCHSIPSGSRACFLLLSPGPSPSVPPIFRVTLPSIVKPSWKHTCRHSERFTVEISHHTHSQWNELEVCSLTFFRVICKTTNKLKNSVDYSLIQFVLLTDLFWDRLLFCYQADLELWGSGNPPVSTCWVFTLYLVVTSYFCESWLELLPLLV